MTGSLLSSSSGLSYRHRSQAVNEAPLIGNPGIDNRSSSVHTSCQPMEDKDQLVAAAGRAAENAYAPYSSFRVGAAVLCSDGTIITGTNVENRSYGLTMCAERVAIGTAVATGKRKLTAIAIVGLDSDTPLPPCGACRQVISEFLGPQAPVYFRGASQKTMNVTVEELIPYDSLHGLRSS